MVPVYPSISGLVDRPTMLGRFAEQFGGSEVGYLVQPVDEIGCRGNGSKSLVC